MIETDIEKVAHGCRPGTQQWQIAVRHTQQSPNDAFGNATSKSSNDVDVAVGRTGAKQFDRFVHEGPKGGRTSAGKRLLQGGPYDRMRVAFLIDQPVAQRRIRLGDISAGWREMRQARVHKRCRDKVVAGYVDIAPRRLPDGSFAAHFGVERVNILRTVERTGTNATPAAFTMHCRAHTPTSKARLLASSRSL
ncbi:MAG: hypothetical protein ABJB10_08845 [Mesorhizobium sp.]